MITVKWRYIPFKRYDPFVKTALNQAAINYVQDSGNGLIWLAGWDTPCVNVGRSQDVEKEVNLDEAKKRNTCIVRREGGGGTTYLTPEGEITWHIIAPSTYFSKDVNHTYGTVCSLIADALGTLGIPAEHEPVNDVVTLEPRRKLSGSTLKQERGVTYVAGTLLYDVDVDDMFAVLTPSPEKLQDKHITDFTQRVTSVTRETNASFTQTVDALHTALLSDKTWFKKPWTQEELTRVDELVQKYRSTEWVMGDG